MRFTQLSLGNWRNFRSAKVPLQPRTFIVGANASGKSNLLDALRFLRDLSIDGGGLQRAVVEQRGGLKGIRSLHAKVDNDVEVSVVVIDDVGARWTYQLRLHDTRTRKPSVLREVVSRDDVVLLRRPGPSEDPDERLETYLETGSKNREFRQLAKFFASIEYVNIVPLVVREQRPEAVARSCSKNPSSRCTRRPSPRSRSCSTAPPRPAAARSSSARTHGRSCKIAGSTRASSSSSS